MMKHKLSETYELEKKEDMERWERYKTTGYAIPNELVSKWLKRIWQNGIDSNFAGVLDIAEIKKEAHQLYENYNR